MNVHVLDPKQEELLQTCIHEFYLTRERPSMAALMREVKRRFSEQELPTPTHRTVCRRVEAIDLRLVIRKREGAKRAREKLGPVLTSTLQADLPLDPLAILPVSDGMHGSEALRACEQLGRVQPYNRLCSLRLHAPLRAHVARGIGASQDHVLMATA